MPIKGANLHQESREVCRDVSQESCGVSCCPVPQYSCWYALLQASAYKALFKLPCMLSIYAAATKVYRIPRNVDTSSDTGATNSSCTPYVIVQRDGRDDYQVGMVYQAEMASLGLLEWQERKETQDLKV